MCAPASDEAAAAVLDVQARDEAVVAPQDDFVRHREVVRIFIPDLRWRRTGGAE